MPQKNYDEFLTRQLEDSEVAAEYLTAAAESGSLEELLVALCSAAQARGGIQELARVTKLNRPSLYKMLSEKGNPTLGSLLALLKAMNLRLTFSPVPKKAA